MTPFIYDGDRVKYKQQYVPTTELPETEYYVIGDQIKGKVLALTNTSDMRCVRIETAHVNIVEPSYHRIEIVGRVDNIVEKFTYFNNTIAAAIDAAQWVTGTEGVGGFEIIDIFVEQRDRKRRDEVVLS